MDARFFWHQAAGMTCTATHLDRAREVSGWLASRKSALQYAAGRGYSAVSLRRWAKLQATSRTVGPNFGFVKLQIVSKAQAELSIEVRGVFIRVSRGFDPELLRSVIDALSEGGKS